MGVDRPLLVQFWSFCAALSGDLGRSLILRVPVSELIWQRLPVTVMLTVMSALLAAVIAVPFAFIAALNRGRGARHAHPRRLPARRFDAGLLYRPGAADRARGGLGWFPVGGFGDNFPDDLYHLVLPALTLAMSLSAILMRNLRASLIEVLGAEYVSFAIAKGLAAQAVILRHVLRNAVDLDRDAVRPAYRHADRRRGHHRDRVRHTRHRPAHGRRHLQPRLPGVQGLTLVIALLVSLVFLVVDIIVAMLDPRPASGR